jgi:ABC-type branched-subunit amino acid transport system substrate-binding protein
VTRSARGLAPPLLALLVFASAPSAQAAELTTEERRGEEVFLEGTSPAGMPITAFLGEGESRLELPGEAAVCGSCHGHDGTGRPESGVLPTNITWKYLTRSYGHVHSGGVEHPPFDEESLRSYLRTGIFPGGAKGDPSMPVYEISNRDLEDLIAYIKRVGRILDPGISDAAIRIGTIVPSEGQLGETGEVIRDVVEACFGAVNATGGIYGRRLELVVHELPAESTSAAESVEEWLGREEPFAFVSPFAPHADVEVQSILSSREIPVVGPFTLHAIRNFSLNRQVFYLYPGLGEQYEALVQFAGSRLELSDPSVAVLYPQGDGFVELIAVLERAARKQGWGEIRREPFAPDGFDAASSVEALQRAGVDVIIALGVERELRSLLTAAAERLWSPHVLASGVLAGSTLLDVPAVFERRLHLAYPTLPQDRKPWALKSVSRILEGNERARAHTQAVISSYSSVIVLVETLRRAGRKVGRRELTAELERLYEFETGLTPPISFTSNRRIGARGAYVIDPGSLEDGRLPESVAWVEIE